MKKLFGLFIFLIIIFFGHREWDNRVKPYLFLKEVSKNVQEKNYEYLKNKVNFKNISKTVIESKSNIRDKNLLENIKISILGFFNQKETSELEQFFISYFSKDELNYLMLNDEELTKLFENIDFDNTSFKLVHYDSNSYIYEITSYNKLIYDNIVLNILIKKNDSGDLIIDDLDNFYFSLKKFRNQRKQFLESFNNKIKDKMNKKIWITEFTSETTQLFSKFGYTTKHKIQLKNKSDDSLIYSKFRIWTSDINDRVVDQEVENNKKIYPNQEDQIYVHYLGADFYIEMMHGNYPKIEILELKFDSGEILEFRTKL